MSSDTTAIEVPMQPYAGQLLVIKDLVQPKPSESHVGTRLSFFDRCAITKKLLKQLAQVEGGKSEKITMYGYDTLVDGLLDALEAYMQFVVLKVVELCEHRCNYKLYMSKRFVMKNDVRTTMTFLSDLEMADYGSSDDDENFYRNIAELEERRERRYRRERKESKLPRESKPPKVVPKPVMFKQEEKANIRGIKASADNIAMLAFGSRKRPAAKTPGNTTGPGKAGPAPSVTHVQQPVSMPPRFKHVTIKDVLQFLEEDKRYCRSNMLYEAYLKYTT